MAEQALQEELRKCIKKHLHTYSDNIVRCTLLHVQNPPPIVITEGDPELAQKIEIALIEWIQQNLGPR